MTVNELIKILNKVENKDSLVTISIDYGWGETMKCTDVNFEVFEKDPENGYDYEEFRLWGENENEE